MFFQTFKQISEKNYRYLGNDLNLKNIFSISDLNLMFGLSFIYQSIIDRMFVQNIGKVKNGNRIEESIDVIDVNPN